MKQEKLKRVLTSKAVKIASDKNLPLSLVDFLLTQDDESTVNNLKVLEENTIRKFKKQLRKDLKMKAIIRQRILQETH